MKSPFVLDEPVRVASSAPDESRWGVHQFPALSYLPDGRIVLMYSDAPDNSATHGYEAPAFIASDDGRNWARYDGELKVRRPHFVISRLFGGEYLVMDSRPYWNLTQRPFTLPQPRTEANVYGKVQTFAIDDAPDEVKRYFRFLPAQRWNSAGRRWEDDAVEYEVRNGIFTRRCDSDVLPRTFVEHPLVCLDGEVLHADYRVQYLLPDGSVAAKRASFCMVSQDNGRRFTPRSVIASDSTGQDMMAEPTLAPTRDNRLVCVLRRADHEQKPMAITWSNDHGHTWSSPQSLFKFGVFPCLLTLKCGVLVLAYGRPGVELRLSRDGAGESWTDPCHIVPDIGDPHRHSSCGYASLLALSDDTFLIAYSDWRRQDDQGRRYKDIMTRKVRVER